MYNPDHWYEFGTLQAPGLLRLALECRAAWEYGATLAAQPLLSRAPRGDGHPVLVFPGLVASDLSTKPLRRFLGTPGLCRVPVGARPQSRAPRRHPRRVPRASEGACAAGTGRK